MTDTRLTRFSERIVATSSSSALRSASFSTALSRPKNVSSSMRTSLRTTIGSAGGAATCTSLRCSTIRYGSVGRKLWPNS